MHFRPKTQKSAPTWPASLKRGPRCPTLSAWLSRPWWERRSERPLDAFAFPVVFVERIDQGKSLALVDRTHRMVRVWRDFKPQRRTIVWPDNSTNAVRFRSLEQEEHPATIFRRIPVQLQQKAMGFSS